MDNGKNDNINIIDILENEKSETVGEYIEFLLSLEAGLEKKHPDVQNSLDILSQLVPGTLNKSTTNINLAVFLLTLSKKDKKIADYYSSLISKYTSTNILKKGENHQNVFALMEELLNEANVIVHPDNEIDKYFNDANYAFAVGIKVEEFYKYIPDQSIQDQIQNVMRLRVAFVMTLLQLRTEKYGILKNIYINENRFSRELALCVLFHTLSNFEDSEGKDLINLYENVKRNVLNDIKNARLQLPDKRLFEIKSFQKKRVMEQEFKHFFVDEKDFEKNSLLKIISTFYENYEKISNQVFPVVAVRNPVTGKIIRIDLTKYGAHAEVMEEVEIPKLYVLQDDIEEYIRKELAKNISNNPHKSLEDTVKEILITKRLDSEATINNIVDTIRASVYSPLNWNRRLLFWMRNFDYEKTVIGNLMMQFISKTLLPSNIKNNLEKYTNIKGSTFFVAVVSLSLGGLPAAVVITSLALGLSKIIKREKNEITFSKSYLNGTFGYTKKDLASLSLNGNNQYLQLLKFILEKDESSLKDYKNVFKSSDFDYYNGSLKNSLSNIPIIGLLFQNKYLRYVPSVNITGVKAASKVQYGFNSVFSILGMLGLKIGIAPNSLTQSLRKSGENVEIIKNLSSSKDNTNKKNDASTVLNLLANHSAVFGISTAVFSSKMIRELTQKFPKGKTFVKLGILFSPNYGKISGNSFLYSLSGRTLQKTLFYIGDNLRLFSKKNGIPLVTGILEFTGRVAGGISNGILNFGNGTSLKRASYAMTGIGVLSLIATVGISFLSGPLITANRVAFGASGLGGGGTAQQIENPFPVDGGTTSGLCPVEGVLSCAQGPLGSFTHAAMGTTPIDISPNGAAAFPKPTYAYAVSAGILKFAGNSCKDPNLYAGSIVSLLAENGDTYEYFHIDYKQSEFIAKGLDGKTVAQGDSIGPLFNLPRGQSVDGCWDGLHLHIQAKNKAGKYYNAELLTVNNWKCNLPKITGTNKYCSDGDLQN